MNKKTIKLLMGVIFCLCILAVSNSVYAASTSISATNLNIEPGQSTTISVSVSATEAYNLKLTADGGTLNGTTANADAYGMEKSENVISATFTASSEGTYKISVTGEITGSDLVKQNVSKSVTITVKKQETAPPSNPNPPLAVKSSNANLSNLGIRPNDFTGFKSGTISYNVSVPYSVSSIEVYANKAESVQTISGTGTKSLNEGSNVFNVVVTAEDGTQKTYTITVVRLAEEVQNNPDVEEAPKVKVALASLSIKNGKINEAFSPDITEYSAEINSDVTQLKVNATANTQDATIDIKYPEEIKEDEDNIVIITVKSGDGEDEKVYTITVKKLVGTNAMGMTNNIIAGAVASGNMSNNNKKTLSMGKIVFSGVIAIIAIVGIAFAVLEYKKDKQENNETINFSGLNNETDIEEKSKSKLSTALNKLQDLENATSATQQGETIDNDKGRHF